MYRSIAKGWNIGSDIHDYLTEIRKQGLKFGDLPERYGELEKQLDELDGVGVVISHVAAFVRNPIRDLRNTYYAMRHQE